MSAADTGGQAFPIGGITTPNGEVVWPEYGMTLRDYFAGQVIAGDVGGSPSQQAKWAYEVADAMLKARTA